METVISVTSYLFTGIWIYASISKYLAHSRLGYAMFKQALPAWIGKVRTWLLSFTELDTAFLLLFKNTLLAGICLSFSLILVFVQYLKTT